MGIKVLAGSKGVYTPINTPIEKFGSTNFVVRLDTVHQKK